MDIVYIKINVIRNAKNVKGEMIMAWIKTEECLPPENVIVDTKIDDKNGKRNHQQLIRSKSLWWDVDMIMYIYYDPTHWRRI